MTTEKVPFRLIQMPCCGHLFCNVNHRLPSFCPCCGTFVFDRVRGGVLVLDENATLTYDETKQP